MLIANAAETMAATLMAMAGCAAMLAGILAVLAALALASQCGRG